MIWTAARIPTAGVQLDGDLSVPDDATGVVLFAHGSGSSRHSPRNREVAATLNRHGLATVLVDLLTPEEEQRDAVTRELRFDIDRLADRLAGIVDWLREQPATATLPIGLFGASTGAAAALVATARRRDAVHAVVSRGGRPDLAGPVLPEVRAATLLLVGERDPQVRDLNEHARQAMTAEVELRIIPAASHSFEEPGALEQVAEQAAEWFDRARAGNGNGHGR
jgi:putative phosphoribosyl transferase